MARVLMLAGYADSLVGFRDKLLQEMVSLGHEVIACAPEAPARVGEKLTEWGVQCRDVPLRRTGTGVLADLRYLFALVALLRKVRPDVVLPYTVKPTIYGSMAAAVTGVPVTGSMITGLGYAFSGESLRRRLIGHLVKTLYRLGLRGNRVVFFQNPDDMALFRRLRIVGRENHPTLINGSGIDLEQFRPASYPSRVSFLLIARLIGEKGVREYAAAARALRPRYPSSHFRLVGWIDENPDAITRQELDAWVAEGTLEYLGRLDDIRPAMADTSVYVLPSFYREGTPRTVLEALAMARPVITTDAPGCRETVVSGENGFLVPVRDVPALAEAMEKFLRQPQLVETMGSASRRLAEEKYDVHAVNRVILDGLGLSGKWRADTVAATGA